MCPDTTIKVPRGAGGVAMKAESRVAAVLALVCLVLFTWLLLARHIGEATYVVLLVAFSLVCIAISALPRLRELDLKSLRLTLDEIRQVKADVEQTKEEIAEMYGGIENLKKQPLVLDDAKMKALGLDGGNLAVVSAVMQYPAGCIKRERERLAAIFVTEKKPEKIAEAILDNSLDDKVFKWNGPETPLDANPKSVEERSAEKDAQNGGK
jgi:hypothetical protein